MTKQFRSRSFGAISDTAFFSSQTFAIGKDESSK